MTTITTRNEDLLNLLFQRRLSNDDDKQGTWGEISSGEKVTIVLITVISAVLCLYFCYYIKCRKELPSDRIPLTLGTDKRAMA